MTWNSLMRNHKTHLALTTVLSASAGASVGILVYARLLEERFQERLKAEIDDARSYFQQMYSTPTFVAEDQPDDVALLTAVKEATDEIDGIPVDLVGQALSAARTYEADKEDNVAEPGDPRPPAPVVVNVFQNVAPSDDVVEALLKDRDTNFPYIITKEEFYQNEPDHEQKKFTYWEADEVLVDDQEEFNPIDDVERVAGEDNLLHFGYGSGDEHVLYVRNETLDPPMDLHITRSTGKYSVEVMALDDGEPHLRHSQPRKFRIRDE